MQLSKSTRDQIKQAYLLGSKGVSSFEFTCDGRLLEHLSQLSLSPIIYFSTPKQTRELVGIGKWAILTNDDATHFLNRNDANNVMLFGGNSFVNDCATQEMPSEYWVLPILILTKEHRQITCRVIFDKRQDGNQWHVIQKTLDAVFNSDTFMPTSKTTFLEWHHTPNKETWVKNINHLKEIRFSETFKKVVLARKTTVVFPSKINPFLMIKDIQENDPNVHHFVVQFSPNCAFIGGTPERLFELNGDHLESEALAGTIKNEAYTEAFIHQEKERDEHRYVAHFIQRAFEKLCRHVVSSEPTALTLKYITHVIQRFRGQLKPNIGPMDALKALHPTPAVAGTPSKVAIDHIRQCEPFSREWYAGPIGVLSANQSIIVVAIRSGIVDGFQVYLYAGAGITDASDPEKEWEELNTKLVGFTKVFQTK
jgi:menaquinone-specific isochorismate synthase